MRATDPFLSEEFEELRATQRRCLREIPSAFLMVPVPQLVEAIEEGDRSFVESELRRLADVELAGLHDLLASVARIEVSLLVEKVLRAVPLRPPPDSFVGLRQTAGREAMTAIPVQIDPEVQHGLVRLVALLTWADDLAEDGYTDVRIQRPPA